jgi:putative flippase GtrA
MAASVSSLRRNIRTFCTSRLARWWVCGIAFTLLNVPILYLLVEIAAVPLGLATLIAGEAGLLVRFLVNDRWVFQEARPTWRRLGQYHVAVAASFVIWWGATNLLSHAGVHYIIASLLATGASVVWSMATNFLWVWRHQPRAPSPVADGGEAPSSH